MKKISKNYQDYYEDYIELPPSFDEVITEKTHLDKQIEYIKEKGILVKKEELDTLIKNKSYHDAIVKSKEELDYFINVHYTTGFVATESCVAYRSKHLIVKSKKKAEMLANKLNLYHDIMLRAYELGYDTDALISNGNTIYGIRYDFDTDPEGILYTTMHSKIQVFVFGIFFSDKKSSDILLNEFKDRIRLYY